MGVEVRPFRSACNLRCTYCYETPQRENGQRPKYDLDNIIAALENEYFPFTLFGGEPLIMPVDDLKRLFEYGYHRHGHNSIQTNGTLITDSHIEIFKNYNVHVGISIDGPDELNSLRLGVNQSRTNEHTNNTLQAIEKLCMHHLPPSLIITLTKNNASATRLPRLIEWLRWCEQLGVNSIRVHPLELDNVVKTKEQVLDDDQLFTVFMQLKILNNELTNLRIDVSLETEALLRGEDEFSSCTWQACDPYTTPAVRGITGEGHQSKCGRTDKDGIDGLKAETPGYERYIALYQTPMEYGGCQGCRFFLMCKGHCPGTGLNGDWRNRTRDCQFFMEHFKHYEKDMIAKGEMPLSQHPKREIIEYNLVHAWFKRENPSIKTLLFNDIYEDLPWNNDEVVLPSFFRLAWNSVSHKTKWESRINQIKTSWPLVVVQSVIDGIYPSVIIKVAPWVIVKMRSLLKGTVITLQIISEEKILEKYVPGTPIFVNVFIGSESAFVKFQMEKDKKVNQSNLGCPKCGLEKDSKSPSNSINHIQEGYGFAGNNSLKELGVRFLPHDVCSSECSESLALAKSLEKIAREMNFDEIVAWMKELLGMDTYISDLHGIRIVKTQLFEYSCRAAYSHHPKEYRSQSSKYTNDLIEIKVIS